ncbi:unnamed protein product [Dicrocoelium dendriticum]|nr:unnamed protein product [Dicrocoelium dendriticum]
MEERLDGPVTGFQLFSRYARKKPEIVACIVLTGFFLINGIRLNALQEIERSRRMMRFRIYGHGATLILLCCGGFSGLLGLKKRFYS